MQYGLQDFESIGENCEFGFVQKKLGIDVGSLLRWAFVDSIAATTAGIRGRFRSAFEFDNLHPAGGGTMVRDVTTGVSFHTGMRSSLRDGVWRFTDAEDGRRRLHAQELQKFVFLRDRFFAGLIEGKRIYVAKRNEGLREQDASELIEAIAHWGPGRLLYVSEDPDGAKAGTVERVDDRVIHGWIDRFAPLDAADAVSVVHWESVLRTAGEAFGESPTRRDQRGRAKRRAHTASAHIAPGPDHPAAPSALIEGAGIDDALEAPQHTRSLHVAQRQSFAALDKKASLAQVSSIRLRLAANVIDRPVDADELAVQEHLAQQFPGRFFDDDYYADDYEPDHARRPASHDFDAVDRSSRSFRASSVAVAARLQSAGVHRDRVKTFALEHLDTLRRVFSPFMYSRLVDIALEDTTGLWDHYLEHGLVAGISPTPLFDPIFYRRQAILAGVPSPQFGEPPILHWLRVGRPAGIVPGTAIDIPFYRVNNPDVPGSDADAYLHYISAGLFESRRPTIWFDPDWYAACGRSGANERFDHFLIMGLAEGRTPGAEADQVMKSVGQGQAFTTKLYDALDEASRHWCGKVSAEALTLLVSLYSPYWHEAAETSLGAFVAFLRDGIAAGQRPGPLFDNAIYRHRAANAGLPALMPTDSAVLHWLKFGCPARIVPTDRFDEAVYLAKNHDIATSGLWGFAHFVRHGLYEGRSATHTLTFRRRAALPGSTAQIGPTLVRQWYSMDFPDSSTGWGDEIPKAAHDRLHALLDSDSLADIFADAQAIEPEVGEQSTIDDLLLLPYYDDMALRHAEGRRRLPRARYDTVICVPWIRVGGADLVAGLLAKAVLRIRPDESVLVLRVDNPHFERANWLPTEADVVDVSDLVAGISAGHQHNFLRCLLRGVSPHRLINVNSRVCWSLFRTCGANLAYSMHLYAYMFCWDQTVSGLRAGYPAEFYAGTTEHVTAYLTDTAYLRDELTAMYRLPPPTADRIVPLFTPAQGTIRTPSVARIVEERAEPASRRLVLWAGRLDRQKRFDLVQEIAKLMPDIEFRCWGEALLDAPPCLKTLPSNIKMQGSFASFDDLPLLQAGAWLFTALWEGMPTTLIELATRGVPIVASAVGGVPELIRAETGWPVPATATAEEYVTCLRDVLSNPHSATQRAEALQRLVGETYNEYVYDEGLDKLFGRESGMES